MTGNPLIDGVILAAGFFLTLVASAGTAALEAVARSRLEELVEEGYGRAELCLHLKARLEALRGCEHMTLVFALLVTAMTGMHYLSTWVHPSFPVESAWWLTPALRTAGIVLLTLAIGSLYIVSATLTARTIGTHRAEQVAMRTAPVLSFLVRCAAPFVRFFTWAADAVIGKPAARARFGDVVTSEEELRDLIEEGTKAGFVDKTERELIESIFRFTDKTAREIMVPRKDVAAIDYSTPPEAILERVVEEGYTRMPVYRGTLDTIVGVINSKDVLSLIEHRNLIILDDIIRPAFFVPDTKPISDLLRDFQRRRIHLAVVVDEFGGTEGIITLEDILEEIVGDIHDEYDEDAVPYTVLPGGAVEVEGRMTISDFNAMFPFAIPESDEYDTVGGFIMKLMGRIPERGDVVERHDAHVEVVDVDGRRIVRARFSPRREDDPGTDGDG